jgi:hypothetical protein
LRCNNWGTLSQDLEEITPILLYLHRPFGRKQQDWIEN